MHSEQINKTLNTLQLMTQVNSRQTCFNSWLLKTTLDCCLGSFSLPLSIQVEAKQIKVWYIQTMVQRHCLNDYVERLWRASTLESLELLSNRYFQSEKPRTKALIYRVYLKHRHKNKFPKIQPMIPQKFDSGIFIDFFCEWYFKKKLTPVHYLISKVNEKIFFLSYW